MRAKKSLGQHFLTSQSALAALIAAADVRAGETVLEIGPGKGVLTRALLEKGADVIAIEKDESLVSLLEQSFKQELAVKRLRIVAGDALEFSPAKLKLTTYKIVANIPYYITGLLLRHFFSAKTLPAQAVLLVQKEVAERIARDSKESVLSLSLKCYGTPRYVKTVPAGSFSPAPKVDSAILSIEGVSRDFFNGFAESFWFALIKAGFAQKRKKLIRNLEKLFKRKLLEQAFESAKIPEDARAEDIALSEWRTLALFLAQRQETA